MLPLTFFFNKTPELVAWFAALLPSSQFQPPPDPRLAQSYHHLALLAFATDPTPGTASAEFCSLRVMEAAATRALQDLKSIPVGAMELEDSKIVR